MNFWMGLGLLVGWVGGGCCGDLDEFIKVQVRGGVDRFVVG